MLCVFSVYLFAKVFEQPSYTGIILAMKLLNLKNTQSSETTIKM